jgi:nitroreductase
MPIEKVAATQHPVHELIQHRWSPRAFADRNVAPATLLSLLEAARWAPSCFNEQPWRYLVATRDNAQEFEHMVSCLVEPNQLWAKHVPVLMLSVAKLNFEHSGQPNRHAFHDVGAASAYLTIQATSMGLFVHQMAGIHVDRAKETYEIPEGFEAVAGIALGYLGEPSTLPDSLRERETMPSTRQALEAMVFTGHWGEKPAFLK